MYFIVHHKQCNFERMYLICRKVSEDEGLACETNKNIQFDEVLH